MRRMLVAAALLSLGGAAHAQTAAVYQCKDASGHISLQSQPCDPSQTVENVSTYRPQRLTRAQEDAIRRRNIMPVERATGAQTGGTATVITHRTNSACALTRAGRDEAYRKYPKMGYEARQSWGETVRNACK